MKPVITVENIAKLYHIGVRQKANRTLREAITDAAAAPWRRLQRLSHRRSAKPVDTNGEGPEDTIWALKDVSFEVQPGDVLGIIGRNGSGKSTLLKILSQITRPTEGRIELRGRVASLLEVGTGFHPELTGRENIFLNGAILGMSRREITRKFDEIVAFSGIEKFIDTPVKHYSSGMYVRLAFAVAAHLEPEILIVDEVLAVGDMEFQKKCLGKMQNVTQQGRTVIFVSHDMVAIKSLCSRAVLLNAGCLTCEGGVDQVVDAYFALTSATDMSRTGVIPDDRPREWGTPEARLRSVRLADASGRTTAQLYFAQPFRVLLTFEVMQELSDAVLEVGLSTLDGIRVTYSSNIDGEQPPARFPCGWHTVAVDLDVTLLPRQYTLELGIHHRDGLTIDWVERALDFTVLNVSEIGNDHYPWACAVRGFVRPAGRWHVQEPVQPLLASCASRPER